MKASHQSSRQTVSDVTRLNHGRQLSIRVAQPDPDREVSDLLEIRSAKGELELAIEIGPTGPRLRVRAVDIELCAEKTLTMRCETLDVVASGGASVAAGQVLALSGDDVRVQAETGEVAIRANDDVDVRGERIRLNCNDPPMPTSWEELEARALASKGGG